MAGAGEVPGEKPLDLGGTPSPDFLEELAEAFRRHRPQGSARWNFAGAFTRLEGLYGAALPAGARADAPPPGAAAGEPTPADGASATGTGVAGATAADTTDPTEPTRTGGFVRRLVGRYIATRLRPRVEAWSAAAARPVAEEVLARGMEAVADGFDTTVEALRFLGARVEQLEDATARRCEPVDGTAWLAPPPPLGPWVTPIIGWVTASRPAGPVLHGECGDGELALALAHAGARVHGIEPRGAVAWRAAARGVDVQVGPVAELLRRRPAGSLGGLVLSGVVDREPLEDLVDLLAVATDRLAPGAPLVVVGTRPEAAATGWDAVAGDLLPGRPLHPETWELLLARAGYLDVGSAVPQATSDGPGGDATAGYVVRGRRAP